MNSRKHLLSLIIWSAVHLISATPLNYRDCYVLQNGDSLVVGNTCIRRVYELNNGNLITRSLHNEMSGFSWESQTTTPDLTLPGYNNPASLISLKSYVVPETMSQESYLETEIIFQIDQLFIKQIIRLYPETPVVGNDFYFKGKSQNSRWYDKQFFADQLTDVRFVATGKASSKMPVLESIHLGGKHWQYKIVSQYEMTDHLNSLVTVEEHQAYHPRLYKGNLLFALNNEKEEGFFLLKESPSSLAQLKYTNADFLASYGNVRIISSGIDEDDISADKWTSSYSSVLGLFSKSEYNALLGLKKYQSRIRKVIPDRDEMIMMNTWGDRGVGKRINEAYILRELELCHQLGVTHFQIDDGWQTGKSPATTQSGSFDNIWERSDYWKPDPTNFPNGLKYVVKKGKVLGIEVCIWFNPSYTNNYIDWKRDAEALIYLNQQYGIRTFKIDGLRIHNKISEERVDSLLSTVAKALSYDVVFNLDVTADKRFGFHFKNKYGNIFLENRYTDFGNYYPYWSLRNLWSLSKYVPTRNLQIEFLNKWRNREKYNDPFAPEHYDFEYLFAITMMAQPLAWMEAQNLPEEAFGLSPVIKIYREIQSDLHNGYILPIGDIPSGRSWTGFQSINNGYGYFLIFRENNEEYTAAIETWLKPGTAVKIKKILGKGEDFQTITDENSQIIFKLAAANSYSLYKYKIIQ